MNTLNDLILKMVPGDEVLVTLIIVCLIFAFLLIAIISFIVYFFFRHKIKKFFGRWKLSASKKSIKDETINSFINDLSSCLCKLSSQKVGALIVIENKDNLGHWIELGNKMTSEFFPELVYTVFDNKKSPLHDGAMIVRNWKIASVSSYLPMTRKVLDVKFGARHRAGFGISETTDAFAFVVSETTGNISMMYLDEHKNLPTIPLKLSGEIYKTLSDNGIFDNRRKSIVVQKEYED